MGFKKSDKLDTDVEVKEAKKISDIDYAPPEHQTLSWMLCTHYPI